MRGLKNIFQSRKTVLSVPFVAVLLVFGARLGTRAAQVGLDRTSVGSQQNKLASGEAEVKRLLLLMDADKDGNISKQEFMSLMEGEFERLDRNKDGVVSAKEVTGLRIIHRAHP